jgi:hypothetical protein
MNLTAPGDVRLSELSAGLLIQRRSGKELL